MNKHLPRLRCVARILWRRESNSFEYSLGDSIISEGFSQGSADVASRPQSAKGQARQDTCYTHSHDI